MEYFRSIVFSTAVLSLVGCGGGGSGESPSTSAPPTYSIGGTVTGLSGSGLILRNNGGNSMTINANGPFSFSQSLASGAAYSVNVQTQPSAPSQICVVTSGSGTVASTSVTGVGITCTTSSFQVGGSVSGLTGNGLTLRNLQGDTLAITANGQFSFPSALPSGSPYFVAVGNQPSTPAQICVASGGGGIVGGVDVANIAITCNSGTPKAIYIPDFINNLVYGLRVNESTGALTTIAGSPFATGAQPQGAVASPGGDFYYVLNTGAGTISGYAVNATTSALTPIAGSPFVVTGTAGAININIDPAGRFIYVPLTGTAGLAVLKVDPLTGALTQVVGSPFALPGYVLFPDSLGRYIYAYRGNGAATYRIDQSTGALSLIGTIATAPTTINTPAGQLHPSGDALFITIPNSDLACGFSINQASGQLGNANCVIGSGSGSPRYARIDAAGRFLYTAGQSSTFGFAIDPVSATASAATGSPYLSGGQPGDFDIDPSGRFIYVPALTVSGINNVVVAYRINSADGSLGVVPGSPFAIGPHPTMSRVDRSGRYLFVVNVGHGSGLLTSFRIDAASGALTLIDSKPAGGNAGYFTLVGTQ